MAKKRETKKEEEKKSFENKEIIEKKDYPEIGEAEKKGLSNQEASKRLEKYGENKIKKKKSVKPLKIFFSQFKSPLLLLLLAAAIVSFAVGYLPGQEPRTVDSVLILIIVFASSVASFFQQYKAEKSIEALQKMATPKAMVVRNGKEKTIPVPKIVPGDVVILNSGDVVPADSKLIQSFKVKLNESILTGESESVRKKKGDSVYKNTSVYVGHAKALVKETGMDTKVGKIAGKLQKMKSEKTPFQKEMSRFSKKILYVMSGLIVIMMGVSLFKFSVYQSLLTAISLAVAAVPEGLPAVVSLALAIGARIMSKKNSLIRRLSVTESIGAIDIICADKTGTLTKNQMTVTDLYTDKVIKAKNIKKSHLKNKRLKHLLFCSSLCNNAEKRQGHYQGDQTEVALKKFSDRFVNKDYERVNELPFTSKRKMMSVLVKNPKGDNYSIYSKGAPEVLLKQCTKILEGGRLKKLDKKKKQEIIEKNKEFASKGLRVLGFAYKDTKSKNKDKEDMEENLVWIGLQAMRDPPHKEVKGAIKDCYTAGMRIIMITGDNSVTAEAISKEIGLNSQGTLEGTDLENMSDKELEKKLKQGYNIFARVDPFHKLRILKILRKNNRIAMTGDGVNDSLALKKADVGISMGIKGTEVAKQSSDMILLDDNFSSIRTAVKEGRRVFQNIRKFVNYLLVSNFAEVLVLFLSTIFLTLKEPILLPVQLLWINLLTDGLPALALGVDPAKKGIMKEKPRKKGESVINKRLGWLIGTIGTKKTLILLATFFLVLPWGMAEARTTLFTGFILYEFVRIGSIRYQEKLSWLSNKWLLGALGLSVVLQLIVIYTPLNKYFHIVPLGLPEWGILIGGVIVGYILAIEITKAVIKYIK